MKTCPKNKFAFVNHIMSLIAMKIEMIIEK